MGGKGGGGGNEPQGRQDFWSKIPFFKFFPKTKFSVSDKNNFKNKVGWAFSPTLKYCWGRTPNLHKNCDDLIGKKSINSSPCHPELVSGSYHRQKCSVICTQKSKVGVKPQPTKSSSASRTAQRHVRGDLVPAFTLAEVFSPYYNSPRKVAFTLAEVLITLGIIGVVVAMTLPTLIQSQQEKEKVVRLKKAYSVINSAIQRAINEDGPISSWSGLVKSQTIQDDMTDEEKEEALTGRQAGWSNFMSHIKPYLNFVKYCENYNDTSCGGDYTRYSLDGTPFSNISERAILADGTGISSIWIADPSCNYVVGTSKQLQKICGEIFIDIKPNGKNGKITGDTIFLFYITEYGLYPVGTTMENARADEDPYTFENSCNISKLGRHNGYGCTAWVLQNENMDYKKCSDLSWGGKTKCK